MTDSIRVRFAPSPTGYLHIGGVRTALFNWLYARHHGASGKFILRIEDTDVSRSTEESIEEIMESMRWLGLDWDEGPFRQMDRQGLYKGKVNSLLEAGKAYKCYCTPEELDAIREAQQKAGGKPKYDGTCRNRTDAPDAPYCIRFKAPTEGTVHVDDILRGKVSFDVTELDDFIILRTDGTPTYNFVVVVDDADMQISHVIRGDDHLSNTPRQALLYDALGLARPKFAHISMILGPDKTRLSKRHGATSVLEYKKQGYLPQAVLNYLARLGWSHGDQEVFTRQEMIELFDLSTVTISAAVFGPDKLLWVNEQWMQKSEDAELAAHLQPFLVSEGILPEGHNKTLEEIQKVVPLLKQRAKTLIEMAQGTAFYFKDVNIKIGDEFNLSDHVIDTQTRDGKEIKAYTPHVEVDQKAVEKFLTPEVKPWFEKLVAGLEGMEDPLDHDTVADLFKKVVEEEGIKLKNLAQPVRVALTGGTASPGIFDVVMILGKERAIVRLKI